MPEIARFYGIIIKCIFVVEGDLPSQGATFDKRMGREVSVRIK